MANPVPLTFSLKTILYDLDQLTGIIAPIIEVIPPQFLNTLLLF